MNKININCKLCLKRFSIIRPCLLLGIWGQITTKVILLTNKVKRKAKLQFLSCIKYNYYIDTGSNITNKIILQK